MRIAYETEIQKPPEAVFSWIEDPEQARKWQKEVKGGEILVDRPEKIGTTFREVIEEDGNRLEMEGRITKFTKNQIIGFHINSKIHEFDVCYSVEPKNENSKITVAMDIHWKFPMNVLSLIIKKKMEESLTKQVESEVLELKRMCEAG